MEKMIKGIKTLAVALMALALTWGQCPGSETGHVQELLVMAGQGNLSAMIDLGKIYYDGRGVLKDPLKARCWIERARERGQDLGDGRTVHRAERVWEKLALWRYSGDCRIDEPGRTAGPASGERFVEPLTGMRFVWISGGCFTSRTGMKEESKKGRRICPKGFWMGETEVTQSQWTGIMADNPSRFKGQDLPVEQVSYEAVQAYIRRLNQATGKRFALPTELQWEFACTGRGRPQPFPWGREEFRPRANCSGCDSGPSRGKSMPVGSFYPNAAGLFDMGGNVREWCRDSRHRDTRDKPVRGGSFVDPAGRSKCRFSERMLPGVKAYYLGFRLTADQF